MIFIRQSVHPLCQAVKQRLCQAKHSVDSPEPDLGGDSVSEHWGALGSIGKDRWFCRCRWVGALDFATRTDVCQVWPI